MISISDLILEAEKPIISEGIESININVNTPETIFIKSGEFCGKKILIRSMNVQTTHGSNKRMQRIEKIMMESEDM